MPDRPDVNPASRRSRLDYRAAPVLRAEHAERGFTRLIEQQTAKIPSDVFLFLALGVMGASLALEISGNEKLGRSIGMWATPMLIMGVYNKLVKIVGPH
ncbi:MAG TPA: hypothetical protein VF158_09125 [Longimicrobiales bacterium]